MVAQIPECIDQNRQVHSRTDIHVQVCYPTDINVQEHGRTDIHV